MRCFRRSQGGNVTIITALSMTLILVLIFIAVGTSQIASGSTDMQGVSDEAALTAGAAEVGLLNDKTVVDLIQWTFQTVATIGNDIEIAGAVATTFGAFALLAGGAGAALIALGRILTTVGGRIKAFGQKLKEGFSKVTDKVGQYIDKAKFILSMANSTIIAGNNGYFGFAIPAQISLPGPSLLLRADVEGFIDRTHDISNRDNAIPPKEKRADALRYRALHQIWGDYAPADGGILQVKDANGNVTGTYIYPRAHPNKFAITTDPWPAGCPPPDPKPEPRTTSQLKLNGQLENDAPLLPDTAILPGETQPPEASGCSDYSELYKLMRQPFNAEINMLVTLKQKLAAQGTFEDGTSTSQEDVRIQDAIAQLENQVSNGNPQWIKDNVAKYDQPNQTIQCPLPSGPFNLFNTNPVSPKTITFYDPSQTGEARFASFDCSGSVLPGVPANPNRLEYFWDGEYKASDYVTPEEPDKNHQHDYRNTGEARNQEEASGLDVWVSENNLPNAGSPGSGGKNDASVFVMFTDVQPSLASDLVGGLTRADQRPSRWAVAASVVQITQAPAGSGDNVSFTQLCGTIFGEHEQPPGLFGLPSNARGWCSTIAGILVAGPAQLFHELPDAAQTLLKKLISEPPNPAAYHAQLVDLCPVPGLSDLTKVLNQLEAARHGDRAQFYQAAYKAVWDVVENYKGDFQKLKPLASFLPPPQAPPSKDCPPNLSWDVHLHRTGASPSPSTSAGRSSSPSAEPTPNPGLKLEPPTVVRGHYETAVPIGTWPPDTQCSITVTSSLGNVSDAQGLTPHRSSKGGRLYAWKWYVGTRLQAPSDEQVVVSCGHYHASATMHVVAA
jgi:hypothetical protein